VIADVRDACTPRSDVLTGGLEDKHFAAQLDQVVTGAAGYEAYADAEQFFALTYPTRGLRDLLASTFSRLNSPAGGGRKTIRCI
jgi:predicted AAA+ superfamily ATPase